MVANLNLPTPSPTADVWGEALNDAITAVNGDVETNKTQISGLNSALAGKADSSAVTTALAGKANVSDLAGKADVSALAGKADLSVVNAEFDSVNIELDSKAATTDVDTLAATVALKANTAYVDAGLAQKANASDIPPEPLFLKEGELVPLGTPAETVIYRTLEDASDVKVTHVSSNNSEAITNFELPDDISVGDVLLAIAVTTGAGRSYTWAAPWVEIFDMSQQRTISAAIYRIPNQAALDDLVTPVITPSGNFDTMVLAMIKLKAQVNTAWPAYSAGNGRSGNTLTSPTNTGFSVSAITTSPFTSFDTEWIFAAAYSTVTGPAPVITLPAAFTNVVDATTGGLAFRIGKRAVSAVPVPLQAITVAHPAGFANANYGGGHFITPTKEA